MQVWRPVRSLGGIIGFLFTLVLGIAVVWLVPLFPGPVSLQTFGVGLGVLVLACLIVILLYWSVAFFTLHYTFDRNGLTLWWGGSSQVIPMNRITEIRRWRKGERARGTGLRWPGYHRRRGRSRELGPVHYYATAGRRAQLLVCTPDEAYAISPRDAEGFVRAMEVRQNLGITRQIAQERRYWWIFGWAVWRDRVFVLLVALAAATNLALLAFLCHRYAALPTRIALHFREIVDEGQVRIIPDIIGPSRDLFKLPVFGLLIFGVDLFAGLLLHRRHRLVVLLLLGVVMLVQLIFLLGAIHIVFRAG